MTHIALGPGTEFDLIRAAWRRLGDRAAPAGDDCAFLTVGSERLAVATDLAVEGTHFRVGWLAPDEIGWRAAAAALSDLAAVAAEPVGVLASVGCSAEWPEELFVQLMDGVGEAARAVGTSVLGGDLVRSERLVVDVAVIGRAPRPVSRSGAAAGDALWLTGSLGGPAAALDAWLRGREPDATARARFARPEPRVEAAHWLRERGAKAMIDVSDGLVADAGQLAAASAVGCVLELERVPVHGAATREQALVSGEEYELLVALPAGAEPANDFGSAFGLSLARVGRVEAGTGVRLVSAGGDVTAPAGFVHF